MWVIRMFFALLFAALVILIDLPLHLITMLIEKAKPGSCTRFRHGFARAAMKGIWFLAGGKTTIIGLENVPTDRPVLFVANHRSIFDIILAGSLITYPVGFVAKKELAKIPLLNLWMKWVYCLFLDRTDIREGLKTILTAIDYVKSGISIAVFPEGTRGRLADEAELLPFHEGSFKVAVKTGCPIIPVCISHSSAIFEDHFPWVRATHVVLEYGAPIYPNELPKDDKKFIGKYVQNIMQETLQKNKTL